MRTIFQDAQLQKQITEKGYVICPAIGSGGIVSLYSLVQTYMKQYSGDFHTTHFSADRDYKREVNDTIAAVVFPEISALLDRFIPVFGNLMVKPADTSYEMPLHADWTYVDENRYRSISVWIPLIDTTPENGCLGVIEGSHRITNQIRGPRIIQSGFRHDADWIERSGRLLPVRAGTVIIYDHALLHYSPANRSKELRPAINLSLVPQDAEIIHYCIPEGADSIEKYKVENKEFYIQYDNFQRPEIVAPVEKLAVSAIELIDERMENFTRKPTLKKMLAKLIGY